MGRLEKLESWCRAVIVIDFAICIVSTIGLLLLICLPQFFRDFMFRVVDEMDYEITRKEEMKPFYEHVLIPILLASIAGVILLHFGLSLMLAYGISQLKLTKLHGWILTQIFLSIITTLAILILSVRFIQYFHFFIPGIVFQFYRFVSISIVFKYEQALLAEDEAHNRRIAYKLAHGGNLPPGTTNSLSRVNSPSSNNNNYTFGPHGGSGIPNGRRSVSRSPSPSPPSRATTPLPPYNGKASLSQVYPQPQQQQRPISVVQVKKPKQVASNGYGVKSSYDNSFYYAKSSQSPMAVRRGVVPSTSMPVMTSKSPKPSRPPPPASTAISIPILPSPPRSSFRRRETEL